jgi:hypothetical protein
MVKKNTFVPVQDLAGNFVMVEPVKKKRGRPPKKPVEENITMVIDEVKKRGRPKKYSTAEEARKAKIANTIASAKKRKGIKVGGVVGKAISPQEAYTLYRDYLNTFNNNPTQETHTLLKARWNDDFGLRDITYWSNLWSREIIGELFQKLFGYEEDDMEESYGLTLTILPINSFRPVDDRQDASSGESDDSDEGAGLFSDFNKKIKGAVQAVSNTAVAVGKKVKDTAVSVVKGRNDYPPKVRNIISKYGDKNITGIMLGRTPLGAPILTALQLASGNTFSQKLENTPYDTLFHLFMCVQLDGKDKIVLEKNEVINAEIGCKLPKDTETKSITSSDIPTGLTLKQALDKTQESMGGKYFTYSAKDNNCQDFIVAFLTANNIGTETDKSWVKQETKILFEGNDRLRKIANTLTDIGARVDVIRQGAGVIDFEDMKWGSFSKQLQAYNSQHKKKLDLHNFAMMILANPEKFKERTKKRARFYINIILKKGGMIDEENDPLFQNPLPIVANLPPPPPPPEPEPVNIPQPTTIKKNDNKKGGKIKKSPVNNIGMANKWIEYVKAYAKKNNMKYSEALKDPKMKAGYKKGEGMFDVLKEVGKAVAPVAIDLASDYAKKKVSGGGMPTSRDAYIAELYDQANLGANGKVRLN